MGETLEVLDGEGYVKKEEKRRGNDGKRAFDWRRWERF